MNNKTKKSLSLLLSVALLITALCVPTAVSAATELTLYVCSPGCAAYDTKTDADGSAEKPFETIYDLITYVNANTNLGEGDIVKVIVEELATINTIANAVHNMTSWTDQVVSAEAIVPSHAYTLYVTSPDGEKNHLAFSHKLAANGDLMIGGPTVFDNIILANNTNNIGKNIAFEGASVTFTENCAFQYTKNANATQFGTLVDMTMDVQLARCLTNNVKNYTGATYTINNGKIGKFFISASRNGGMSTTYSEDVNIIADNSALNLNFVWGSYGAKASSTFQKNLNINIKDAASITQSMGTNKGVVTVNGALQVIYPEDITFDMSGVTTLTAGSTYYLKNKTGNADALTFTATAGVYNVAEGVTVTALDSNNNAVKVSSEGVLDLRSVGAGTYSIVEGEVSSGGSGEEPEQPLDPSVPLEYYVKSPGYTAYGTTKSSADGSQAKPFETVYDLVDYVNKNKNLDSNYTVNAIILQRADYKSDGSFGSTTLNGSSAYMHSITAWSYIDDGNASVYVPKHQYKLVLKSPEGEPNYLAFSAKMGANVDVKLGGPTVFDNVKILNVRNGNENKCIYFEDNDVTFTENCSWHWTKMKDTGTWDKSIHANRAEYAQLVRASSGTYTYDKQVDINLLPPLGKEGTFNFYIPSLRSNNAKTIYNKDVNMTVDNASSNVTFTWGNNCALTSANEFNGNLNINIKNATSIINKDGLGDVKIGTLQVLAPSNVNFQDVTAFDGVTAEKSIFLNVRKQEGTEISFMTDENGEVVDGKFVFTEGFTAIVADENGEIVKTSTDGVLDLTDFTGVYTVRFANQYDNDGSTLTVYKEGEIDLSTVEHNDIPGMVFIGWSFADGTSPEKVANYKVGDVLYAQYVEFTTDDFKTEEYQVRDDGNDGDPSLRFIHSMKNGVLPKIIERGTLILPVSKTYGTEMYLDEPIVWLWSADKENPEFNPGKANGEGVGEVPVVVSGENILTETEDTLKYTICITNISEEDYNTYYAVRGYIKFADNNGISYIFYANQEVASLYKAATESTDKTATENAIIGYVENDAVANYWLANGLTANGRITSETATQYLDTGCGCTDKTTCNHKIFRMPTSTKLYVRDIVIDGLGIEETDIAFITDTHFDYVNQDDIKLNSTSLQTYRSRQTFIEHSQKYVDWGIMEFVSMFKKTVNGGDVIDFLSWGSLLTANRLVTKQTINNVPIKKIVKDDKGDYIAKQLMGITHSMVVGNHDAVNGELVNLNPSDVSLFAAEEGTFDKMRPYWTNDLSYDSEILLDSKGNDKVMMIYLDNSFIEYNDYQYNQLSVDLEYARKNNVPVLVFQHRPMLTMNPDETEFMDITGYHNGYMVAPQDKKYYDITFDEKGNKVYTVKSGIPEVAACAGVVATATDMTSFDGYSGYGVDPTAKDAYNLIRMNADIIKGVFCGHIHANTESHIVGLNADGTSNDLRIPQYTGYLANYGSVTRIILK